MRHPALAAVVVLGAIMTMLDATIVKVGGGAEMFSANLDVLLGYGALLAAPVLGLRVIVAATRDTGLLHTTPPKEGLR